MVNYFFGYTDFEMSNNEVQVWKYKVETPAELGKEL